MGMFDNVVCESPMFDGPRLGYQTKTFDMPFLRTYRITAEGRLLGELVHYEDRSDPTAPPDSLASLQGMMTPVHDGWEDLNWHGFVNFYGYQDHTPDAEWFEYNAKFTDGQLVSIERVVEEIVGPELSERGPKAE